MKQIPRPPVNTSTGSRPDTATSSVSSQQHQQRPFTGNSVASGGGFSGTTPMGITPITMNRNTTATATTSVGGYGVDGDSGGSSAPPFSLWRDRPRSIGRPSTGSSQQRSHNIGSATRRVFQEIDELGLLQPVMLSSQQQQQSRPTTSQQQQHAATTARNVTSRLVFDPKSFSARASATATATRPNTAAATGGEAAGRGVTSSSSSASSTTGAAAANFRSPCVSIQVALHELAATAVPRGALPDASRARKLIELLRSTGTLCNDPIMAHVLHVLSLELHRCVFGPSQATIQKYADNLLSASAGAGPDQSFEQSALAASSNIATSAADAQQQQQDSNDNNDNADDDDVAYFDQLEEVSREHRLLLAELNAVENTNRQDQMAAELDRFRAVVPFYEHEINRLNREAVRKGEDVEGLRDELSTLQRIHDRSIVDFELQNKLLLKDVRELQVRLFQVSKSAIETEAGEEMYQMLKTTKAEQLQGLFERCNERASVSLFLIQIEFLLNTVLTRHEAAVLNQPCRRWPHLVTQFRLHDTECLLEEYNELADRREALDTIMSSVFADHSNNNNNNNSSAIVKATQGVASSDCSMSRRRATQKQQQSQQQQQQLNLSSEEKSAIMFGARLAPEAGNPARATEHIQANVSAFHRNAVQPLLEVTATKRFRTGIEVHVETAAGDEQMLRTVQSLNPLHVVKLPPRSQVVKLKFVNPMLKNPARNFGDDDKDFLVEDSITSGSNVLDWVPEDAADSSNNNNKSREQQQQPQQQRRKPHRSFKQKMRGGTNSNGNGGDDDDNQEDQDEERSNKSPETIELEQLHDKIWEEFRVRYGSYRPAMPRKLRIDICDLHISRAFVLFRKRILYRFLDRVDIALKTGAETVDSATQHALTETTQSYSHRAVQAALLEALEELYVYPELVMKVAWEILTAIEGPLLPLHPHVRVYLRVLGGAASPWLGSYTALMNYKLGANWPQPTLREDDPAGSIPPTSMLALLHIVYPMDCQLFRSDQVPPTDPFLEQFLGQLGNQQRQLAMERQQQEQLQREQEDDDEAKDQDKADDDDGNNRQEKSKNSSKGSISINITTNNNSGVTLRMARDFLNGAILSQEDPWSFKIGEAVTFYSSESQWSQLDAAGTYDAVKQLLVIDKPHMRDEMMLHHAWACGQMGHENRLPGHEVTRIVAEMVCCATHCAGIEMPAEIRNM